MESFVKIASEFGYSALVSLALGWFIVWIMKAHREERATDRAERKEISDASLLSNKELTAALTSLQLREK